MFFNLLVNFYYNLIIYSCFKNIYRIQKKSGYEFKDMIFFDDEPRNKRDLEKIGVLTIMVECGVSKELFKEGLLEYVEHVNS